MVGGVLSLEAKMEYLCAHATRKLTAFSSLLLFKLQHKIEILLLQSEGLLHLRLLQRSSGMQSEGFLSLWSAEGGKAVEGASNP